MVLEDDAWEESVLGGAREGVREDLRRRVLEETVTVVRRRRWRTRLLRGAALAACLAIGIVVGRLWPDAAAQPRVVIIEKDPSPIMAEKKFEPAPPAILSAAMLESQAFDTPSKRDRAARYIAAGNRYLEEDQDHESALRCYRQALDVAVEGDMQITPDDTWLLVALKNARQKEKSNDEVVP